MVLDPSGYPSRAGRSESTDERFWDGTRLPRLVHDDVANRRGTLLCTAGVIVLDSMGCCPGTGHRGSCAVAERR